MKFESDAAAPLLDKARVFGRPQTRVEGPLKVSGHALYAQEHRPAGPPPAHGWIVGAALAPAMLRAIDVAAARAAPGVLAVVTHENAGPIGNPPSHVARCLAGPAVQHYGQAVALVVAETLEQARAAAALVTPGYVRSEGCFDLGAEAEDAAIPGDGGFFAPITEQGDFDAAFVGAPVRIDRRYATPDHAHAMMEPHASVAAWDGDRLTLWTSTQMVAGARRDMAALLGMPADRVRVISSYVGGGFGAKLRVRADALLAALGARAAGRPVKVAMSRPLTFNASTHRPATLQRIRLGADRDGRLRAIAHDSVSGNLPGGMFEPATLQTRHIYGADHRRTAHRRAALDLPEGNAMRAPGEAVGMLALETAMDELAEACGLDPVELRLRNNVPYDAGEGPDKLFSGQMLAECLTVGASRFGWEQRHSRPRGRRAGDWFVGMGVASAYRAHYNAGSAARVSVDAGGHVTVETDMTDIGTGSYTILAQTAAEMLGVDMADVTVRLGDSDFPVAFGSGGQMGANSAASGVYAACLTLREALARKAGFNAGDARFEGGEIRAGNRAVSLGAAAGPDGVRVEDSSGFTPSGLSHGTFGAHFAEVAVNAVTAEVRLRRMAGVFACGRIINPLTARSQIAGSMVMGAGAALMEELVVDPGLGGFLNHDLAEYAVPVHADIPAPDVVFLDDPDPAGTPLRAKGVGELGICGIGAAIANAVHNACGVRLRAYPLTVDRLLPGLMALEAEAPGARFR